ncbi:MAG TPA: energy transducer TonB [Balneolales bacterium]|nr:energy transducer TonB [Balneolales bacterium]
MKQIVQTHQKKTPPPPPRPQTPVAVPNDQVINDQPINLNAEMNMNKPLNLPPPPKNSGKKKKKKQKQVFVVVEHMPKLIGGLKGLEQKIKYPELARKAGIEGKVYVQFVVNKHGNVENAKVVRGIGGGCDKEALKVVRKAHFKPGMQRGRPVNVRYSLPIVFKLQN